MFFFCVPGIIPFRQKAQVMLIRICLTDFDFCLIEATECRQNHKIVTNSVKPQKEVKVLSNRIRSWAKALSPRPDQTMWCVLCALELHKKITADLTEIGLHTHETKKKKWKGFKCIWWTASLSNTMLCVTAQVHCRALLKDSKKAKKMATLK